MSQNKKPKTHPAEETSKNKALKLKSAHTRGKNFGGQTNGQFEMTLKERGKGQTTEAGGAPRQVY